MPTMADNKAKIREFIGKHVRGHELTDDEDIFASGFVNSMFAMQLVQFVETAFGVAVENEDLEIDNSGRWTPSRRWSSGRPPPPRRERPRRRPRIGDARRLARGRGRLDPRLGPRLGGPGDRPLRRGVGPRRGHAAGSVRRVAEAGFLGALVPREQGGAGADWVTFAMLNEELGRGCSSIRSLLTVHSMATYAVLRWGSRAQKERWLGPLARGETSARSG
jgi:acyl carrier protein